MWMSGRQIMLAVLLALGAAVRAAGDGVTPAFGMHSKRLGMPLLWT